MRKVFNHIVHKRFFLSIFPGLAPAFHLDLGVRAEDLHFWMLKMELHYGRTITTVGYTRVNVFKA